MDFFAPLFDFLKFGKDSDNATTTTTTTTTASPTFNSLDFEITSSALIIVLVVLLVAFLAICIHCDNTNTNNDYDRAEPPQQLEAGNVPVELLDENRAAEQTIVAKRNPGFYLQPVKAAPEDFSGIEKDIDSILAKRKWNKAKQAAMKSPADGEEAVAGVDVQEAEAAVVLPNEAPA